MITYKVNVHDDRTEWYLDGKLHRSDGPAVEWLDGAKFWYLYGEPHRLDGPAIEYANGSKYWYLDGEQLTEKEHAKQTQGCAGKTVKISGVEYLLVAK